MNIKISPSILSADFAELGNECKKIIESGSDLIHVDVMDGHFVPNITIGAPVLHSIKPHASIPLDVHLMIDTPERFAGDFIKAGADILTVHAEATESLGGLIETIAALGAKPAVAVKPGTPVETIFPYLEKLAMVLIMTVEPGFGGQKLIESTLAKITALRRELAARGLGADIEVDGGITPQNVSRVAQAGANVFVAGSAVFRADNMRDAVSALRAGAQSGLAGTGC